MKALDFVFILILTLLWFIQIDSSLQYAVQRYLTRPIITLLPLIIIPPFVLSRIYLIYTFISF